MEEEKTYKIKIDVAHGLFEAEGSKYFVELNFNKFETIVSNNKVQPTSKEDSSNPNHTTKKNNPRSVAKSGTPSIVKDLNLRPEGKKSLKEIFEQKSPESNIDKNTVFVYYLQEVLGLQGITLDHIYTCYMETKQRIPGNLRQSIFDTASSRYGYLDTKDVKNIKLSTQGQNLVIHDLPRKIQES